MNIEHLDLTDPRVLMPILRRHGFHTKKSLGQHFLISPVALKAIVQACAPQSDLPIMEIGPGVGTLTRALAEAGAAVTAVELDDRAIAVLHETVGEFPTVRVIRHDILTLDLPAILGNRRWTVVGNLPYYITTPVMTHILEHAASIDRAVFMVQREVADRLKAAPGSKIYGSLSVFAQVFAEVSQVARVPRGAFLPPPAVDSTVVLLNMRAQPLAPPLLQPAFFTVVRAAFGQRRKTLENALAGGGICGGDRDRVSAALAAAGIEGKRRGETLTIAEFLKVAEEVSRNP